jgi:flap endonuclease-1
MILCSHDEDADPSLNYSEDRIRKGAERLTKAIGEKQQGRLDSFFTVSSSAPPKRKADDDKKSVKKGNKN